MLRQKAFEVHGWRKLWKARKNFQGSHRSVCLLGNGGHRRSWLYPDQGTDTMYPQEPGGTSMCWAEVDTWQPGEPRVSCLIKLPSLAACGHVGMQAQFASTADFTRSDQKSNGKRFILKIKTQMRANKTHLWAGKGLRCRLTLLGSLSRRREGPMVEPLEWPAWGPGLSRLLRQSQPLRHRTPRGEMLKCCPDPNGPRVTQPGKQPLSGSLGSGCVQALGLAGLG